MLSSAALARCARVLPRVSPTMEPVAQPLHGSTRDKDGSLERVLDRLVAEAPGDGREHRALALNGLCTGVHQGEGARPVGVLGQPALEGDLAEEGGLLVAGHARDRDLRPEDIRVSVAVDVRARLDL